MIARRQHVATLTYDDVEHVYTIAYVAGPAEGPDEEMLWVDTFELAQTRAEWGSRSNGYVGECKWRTTAPLTWELEMAYLEDVQQ
jgi:hypothetical protein